MKQQYRVTKTYRNNWGEVVFVEGEIVERVYDAPPLYRNVNASESEVARHIALDCLESIETNTNE